MPAETRKLVFCPRCGQSLNGEPFCPRCQTRTPSVPGASAPQPSRPPDTERLSPLSATGAPSPSGKTYRVTFLGHREWFQRYMKVNVRVDGALIGTLGRYDRIEACFGKEVVEVQTAIVMFGKERDPRTTLVRLDDYNCLQIRTTSLPSSWWVQTFIEKCPVLA